jgi:hypothetical protein
VQVGDRVALPTTEVDRDTGAVTTGPPEREWVVLAIEPTGDEGRVVPLRRKGFPDAVWDGTLVLGPGV